MAVAWLGYVYIGYPVLLAIIGLMRRFRPASRDDFLPAVSVLVSARNEEKDIGWKIRETLNWDYPADRLELLVASDASEDRTDEIVRAIQDSRLKFVRMERRVGKNVALNHLAQVAKGEILFFTDANSHVPSSSLRRMVRYFADARVGCVTGAARTKQQEIMVSTSVGERSYWRYESRVQQLESKIGSVLICFGAIFCMRRSLFAPLHADLANDLELPIRVGSQGLSLIFEREAYAVEKAPGSPREEFNRRRRICSQGMLGFWRLRGSLKGLRAWQFLSRKLLRWLILVPMGIFFVSSAALYDQVVFKAFFAAQIVFCMLAFLGWLLAAFGRSSGRLVVLPFYFLLVNLAAFFGVIETILGRRYRVWEIAALTRGPDGNSARIS